jgi:DNA-binding NarL/FixJ family response regulator
MRWLMFGVALTLLGFAHPATAQDKSVSPLERLIESSYEIRLPAHECTVPSVVLGLAKRYRFVAGAEYLLVDCQRRWMATPRDAEVINLQGLSVGAALQKLTEIDPRYRWIERDGVIVVRPLEAWADPKNMLNFAAESFVLDDVNVGSALEAVVSALTGESRSSPTLHQSSQHSEQAARLFSVKTGPTSVGEALSAIVRAHGDAWWQFGGPPGRPDLPPVVSIYTFDGTGLGVSTRKRSPH